VYTFQGTSETPKTLPERIEYVGTALYGTRWTKRLAAGLRISRSQLYEYRVGRGNRDRNIDGELIDLIERERAASAARGMALTQLRNYIASLAKARKEKRDAA
jgi:hypothetical protein